MSTKERRETILDTKLDLSMSDAVKVFRMYQENPTLAAKDFGLSLPWHQRLILKCTIDSI